MTGSATHGRGIAGAVTTSFLLVRHAESEANAGNYFGSQSDAKLTHKGLRQVEALAAALAGVAIDAVYSSDLSRAHDTVAPIARARGLEVQMTDRLRERAMGVLTGLSFDEAKAKHPELWRHLVARTPDVAPPGGESHRDLFTRISAVLTELHERHRGQTIVVGGHGVALNHGIRYLAGVHDFAVPMWMVIENASVSRIDLVDREGDVQPRVVYLNRVAPIEDAGLFG